MMNKQARSNSPKDLAHAIKKEWAYGNVGQKRNELLRKLIEGGIWATINSMPKDDPVRQGIFMEWESIGAAIYSDLSRAITKTVGKDLDKIVSDVWKRNVHTDWVEGRGGWSRQATVRVATRYLMKLSSEHSELIA